MIFLQNHYRTRIIILVLGLFLMSMTGCGKQDQAEAKIVPDIEPDVLIFGEGSGARGDTLTIPLMLNTREKVMGIQFDLVWDSSMVAVGEPELSLDNEHMSIRTRDKLDRKTVIIFSLQGRAMDLVSNEVLKIPVTVRTNMSGETPLQLTQVIVAGQGAGQLDIGAKPGKIILN